MWFDPIKVKQMRQVIGKLVIRVGTQIFACDAFEDLLKVLLGMY
jgi:hypothetical protein